MIWRDKGCLVTGFGGLLVRFEAAEKEAPPPKVVVVIGLLFLCLV